MEMANTGTCWITIGSTLEVTLRSSSKYSLYRSSLPVKFVRRRSCFSWIRAVWWHSWSLHLVHPNVRLAWLLFFSLLEHIVVNIDTTMILPVAEGFGFLFGAIENLVRKSLLLFYAVVLLTYRTNSRYFPSIVFAEVDHFHRLHNLA